MSLLYKCIIHKNIKDNLIVLQQQCNSDKIIMNYIHHSLNNIDIKSTNVTKICYTILQKIINDIYNYNKNECNTYKVNEFTLLNRILSSLNIENHYVKNEFTKIVNSRINNQLCYEYMDVCICPIL